MIRFYTKVLTLRDASCLCQCIMVIQLETGLLGLILVSDQTLCSSFCLELSKYQNLLYNHANTNNNSLQNSHSLCSLLALIHIQKLYWIKSLQNISQ